MKPIAIGVIVFAVAFAAAADEKKANVLFQAAQAKETVQGDLKAAIALYGQAAKEAAPNRGLAAKALLHMAECYQKMGAAESRTIYEQIVREYADQKEAVAEARARLGKAASGDTRMSFREVWSLSAGRQACSTMSRDGRFLPYIDWNDHGNLFLHDFSLDTERRLTSTGTDGMPGVKVEQFADDLVSFSRDGRQLAYPWYRGDINRYEMRLMDLRGEGVPPSRLLFDNPDIEYLAPTDWSPDGTLIAVKIQRPDKTGQIGLVSVPDGRLRILKPVDRRGPKGLIFSPDGKYLAYDRPGADNADQRHVFVLSIDGSREISAAGGRSQDTVVGWSNDGKRLLFASDRSGSIGLWSVPFMDGKVAGSPELLRPDIGDISSLGVTDGGKLYAVVNPNAVSDVYVATIDFFSGKVLSPPALAAETYVGNNQGPAWSPDGKNLAYTSWRSSVGGGHSVIAIRSMETGSVRELSPSEIDSKLSAVIWAPDGSALLFQGRDTKGRAGIFRVDTQSAQSSMLVTQGEWEGIGLMGISPDGKRLYYESKRYEAQYARETQGRFIMEKDLATGAEKELRRTQNQRNGTLSPDGRSIFAVTPLDGPYQTLYVLPAAGGEPRKLAEAKDIGLPMFDGGIGWAPDGSALYGIQKSGQMWRIPVDGSRPHSLNLKWEGTAPQGVFRVHPDGRRIAFWVQGAHKGAGVWALENFLPALTAKE